MTNADKFKHLFGIYATELWAMPESDFLEWLNADAQNMPTGKWIPCSERLPGKDTCFYLATIANHGLNFTTTLPDDVDVVRWDYDRRKGHNSWHWCTERTVIAWMPLPEPYNNKE